MDILLLIVALAILAETSLLVASRRSVRPAGSFAPRSKGILVDTSVLIDGRILDIAECGFIPGRLIIPRSVLGELQLLADGADHEKRIRARNGLEVVTKLQGTPGTTVEIYRDESDAREGVDNRLLALARRLGYDLCTVDYNLQKVAQAESITTLSINELSQKLRALYLPGEKIDLVLKQKGQEKGQAIGYASDGTMVVVDGADKLIDQTATVEIIRSLQTNSGKMMFAKLVQPAGGNSRGQNSNGRSNGRTQTRQQPQRSEVNTEQPVAQANERQNNTRGRNTNRNNSSRSRRSSQSPEDDLMNLVNNQ